MDPPYKKDGHAKKFPPGTTFHWGAAGVLAGAAGLGKPRPRFGAELSEKARVGSIGATSSHVLPQLRSALRQDSAHFLPGMGVK